MMKGDFASLFCAKKIDCLSLFHGVGLEVHFLDKASFKTLVEKFISLTIENSNISSVNNFRSIGVSVDCILNY